ncbi:MAG TPA: zinc ribbon domain-containing protein [Solirubrobacterales bacterium]|nr:zinc ribbon domain-containing protein [Solirubrobacterales bacterium]
MSEAGPDLSVVCKSCGSEVSPYVTECPYCGTRLRKRAPRLERVGDEVRVREGRRERRRRRAAERRARAAERRERLAFAAEYPLVTIAAIVIPAALLVVERATALTVFDFGALDGSLDGEPWRLLTASFVFDDVGFLFAYGLALAIFLTGIERRLGAGAALALVLATAVGGIGGAELIEAAIGDGALVTWGGNGVALGALCAWTVIRESEARADPDEGYERIAVAVAAVVLLAIPIFDDAASAWVGIAGGVVGAAGGLVASRVR